MSGTDKTDKTNPEWHGDNLDPATPEELREVEKMLENMGKRNRINKMMEDVDREVEKSKRVVGWVILFLFLSGYVLSLLGTLGGLWFLWGKAFGA